MDLGMMNRASERRGPDDGGGGGEAQNEDNPYQQRCEDLSIAFDEQQSACDECGTD